MSDASADAFARLHPSVRYAIATHLGWTSLRPVQEEAIPSVASGATTLVLAPTAGGKTEAAMFPLFSRLLDERWAPTSVLYLAPLRALLNDLGDRLGTFGEQLGLRVGVWHGDVDQAARRRLVAAPPDVLLTTPESLEVLLSLASDDRRHMLTALRAVVVDEIHAFYGSDRGTQLLSLLERLRAWSRSDVQRIGLSATIGNPDDLLAWLRGSSPAPGSIVRPERGGERTERFDVTYRESLGGIVDELRPFVREKAIVFCRTRSVVEELAHTLTTEDFVAWPHHSALSRANREDAEREFREARAGLLVATSTLELGIDIGNVDRVVQVDAPTTVASLLQRLGRSGRRTSTASMSLVATNPEQLLLGLSLLSLRADGWVEPITPPWRPFAVLVQQLLASIIAGGGVERNTLAELFARNTAFSRISRDEILAVLDHLVAIDVLEVVDGGLTLGRLGELRYAHRNFVELASVFVGADSVSVRAGDHEVGTLDRWFIDDMRSRDRSTFLLNGRAWNVVRWPEDDAVLSVAPQPTAQAPLFLGSGLVLSFAVMQRMRRIIGEATDVETTLPPGTSVSGAARAIVADVRDVSRPLALERPSTPVVVRGAFTELHTYAGLGANRFVADAIFEARDQQTVATNAMIKVRTQALDLDRTAELFRELASDGRLGTPLALAARPSRETKFSELLDTTAARDFFEERMYDRIGARSILTAALRRTRAE